MLKDGFTFFIIFNKKNKLLELFDCIELYQRVFKTNKQNPPLAKTRSGFSPLGRFNFSGCSLKIHQGSFIL